MKYFFNKLCIWNYVYGTLYDSLRKHMYYAVLKEYLNKTDKMFGPCTNVYLMYL